MRLRGDYRNTRRSRRPSGAAAAQLPAPEHLISMQTITRACILTVILLLCPFIPGANSAPPQTTAPAGQQTSAVTQVQMQNVMYRFADEIAVHILSMKGEFAPTQPGGMPVFDDPSSFKMVFTSAEVSIDSQTLAKVLNRYVFAA